MSRWFCNDNAISEVSIDDRAFQYGDGLFETVAIRNGEPRLWKYHLERLERGCEKLRLPKPDRASLRSLLELAIRQGDADPVHCTAKIILSAGISDRGYTRGASAEAALFAGLFTPSPVASRHYLNGVDTKLCDIRLALFSATAGCKTLNRIEQVLARLEIPPGSVFEGLTLDAEGRVICGTMSNVFIVHDTSIATPSLERCGVEGVMRRHVIAVLRQHGQAVAVRDIDETEFMSADEIFICNSQFGLLPVRGCGSRTWDAHPVTRSVMSLMGENDIAECRL